MPKTIANTLTGIRALHTKIWDDNGYFAVQLYSTVVYEEDDHKVTLRTGGWNTPTTASRINQALAYRNIQGRVNVKNGELYFSGKPFVNGVFVIKKI